MPHTLSQAPQLRGSVSVCTQWPRHAVPAGQTFLHVPPPQMLPAGHTVPQAPQLLGSVWVSVQIPLQAIVPVWHMEAQAPAAHTCPAGHAMLHAPQCAGSLVVSTHWLLHEVRPAPQAHVPPRHREPPVHATPQAPQFWLLLLGLMQALLQSMVPPGHESAMHMLALHACWTVHIIVHDPQC
jgi:hypothetical protein